MVLPTRDLARPAFRAGRQRGQVNAPTPSYRGRCPDTPGAEDYAEAMMGAALVEDAVAFMLSAYDERGRLEDAEHSLEVAALLVDAEATPEVIAAGAS